MRKLFPSVFVAILLSLLLSSGFRSQAQRPEGAQGESPIRTETSEVVVDALVEDRKNHVVTNLGAKDFAVYEDGVEQEIESFSVIHGALEPVRKPVAPGAPKKTAATDELSAQAALPNLTILLLDYSTTQFENENLVRDASVKYVREKLQPNDWMAVFVLGSSLHFLTNFTNDKPRLIAALQSKDIVGSAISAERAAESSIVDAGQAANLTSIDSSLTSGVTTSGPGAAGIGAGLASAGSALGQAMLAQRISAAFTVMRSGIDQRQTRGVLVAIRAIAESVKQIRGRKTLILFSQGFVVGESIEPELHTTTEVANRAHLAIYCIDTHGLETKQLNSSLVPTDELTASSRVGQRDRTKGTGGETIFDATLQAGRDLKESALRYVANATGGFYIHNTNDLEAGLARTEEEMHSYFLLTYRPKNSTFDGKFRQIRVEVQTPGYTVRARNGYFAIPAEFDFLAPEEFQILQQARAVTAAQQMPLYARAGGFREENGQYRVPVILEIPTQAIQFEQNGQDSYAELQIVGMIRDRANNVVARFGGPAGFHLTGGEYQVLAPGNISFMNTVRLPAGKLYTLEAAVRDKKSGKTADRQLGLLLQQPELGLALSSILLAKEVEKSASVTNEFLLVDGTKILPSARCEFHNGDNLIFYFDIYHPQLQSAENKADVSVDLVLLHDGQPVNVRLPSYRLDQATLQPISHITVARYIQLAGLVAGQYSLVVQVKDALANQVRSAQTPFSVVN